MQLAGLTPQSNKWYQQADYNQLAPQVADPEPVNIRFGQQLTMLDQWNTEQRQKDYKTIPRHYERVFVSFSGGKDSVASYIIAKQLFGKDKITLIFADTGDELDKTYEYVRWFNANVHPVVRISTRVASRTEKKRNLETVVLSWIHPNYVVRQLDNLISVFNEIDNRWQSRQGTAPFPANGIRFCTKTLKVRAFDRYIKTFYPEREDRDKIAVCIGLRRKESSNRADTELIAEDFDNGWDVVYPIFDYSKAEVFNLHLENNIPINPAYNIRERSNCIGCPFASNKEIANTVDVYGEEVIAGWVALEQKTGFKWKNGMSIQDVHSIESSAYDLDGCTSGFCDVG